MFLSLKTDSALHARFSLSNLIVGQLTLRTRDWTIVGLHSFQVQKELDKAKTEEARLRQDLNKAREKEREEKKRVR